MIGFAPILALIQAFTTGRQTAAQQTGQVTDRINKAVEELGADKHVCRQTKNSKGMLVYQNDTAGNPDPKKPILKEKTEPNIEVRTRAIYALDHIAAKNLSFHIQIMEILCAYIRHNSSVLLASNDPKNLTKPREDIQTALTVLGRRSESQIAVERAVKTPDCQGHRLDLRATCLQAVDLTKLNFGLARFENAKFQGAKFGGANLQGANFEDANLQGAHLWHANLHEAKLADARLQGAHLESTNLQGAILWGAKLQGANLGKANLQEATLWGANLERADLGGANLQEATLCEAKLQGADFGGANLQGAYLSDTKLQGANLGDANLQGADLRDAKIDDTTSLKPATLRGAGLREVDFTHITNPALLAEAFGDASVTLPDGYVTGQGDLAHWSSKELGDDEFHDQWRAHQKSIGFEP